jgi:hypothetical protein
VSMRTTSRLSWMQIHSNATNCQRPLQALRLSDRGALPSLQKTHRRPVEAAMVGEGLASATESDLIIFRLVVRFTGSVLRNSFRTIGDG